MLSVQRKSPIDYSKCNQQITVYHQMKTEQGEIFEKHIYDHAFFDFRKVTQASKLGVSESTNHLLIIPNDSQTNGVQPIYAGDKVLLGAGGAIQTRAEWNALIPSKVANLAVIQSVDPKYFNGAIVHWEAM